MISTYNQISLALSTAWNITHILDQSLATCSSLLQGLLYNIMINPKTTGSFIHLELFYLNAYNVNKSIIFWGQTHKLSPRAFIKGVPTKARHWVLHSSTFSIAWIGKLMVNLLAWTLVLLVPHYNDVIMSTMTSQVTSLTIVYLAMYSGTEQRKHQRSTSQAFVRGIHWWLVNSPHKGPVM